MQGSTGGGGGGKARKKHLVHKMLAFGGWGLLLALKTWKATHSWKSEKSRQQSHGNIIG